MSTRLGLLCLFGLMSLAACTSPTVVQGTVVSWEPKDQSVVVKDELPPNSELKISTSKAEIGAEPTPGDVVRIAYLNEGGVLKATRVMNISRQRVQPPSGGH